MNKGFWNNLPKPFFALAPMYDVTDEAFRRIIAKYGKPDVFYTEFVSTDGLNSDGRSKLLHHLQLSDIEHPIVAQVFGAKPEKFAETAKLVKEFGFDGIDINMGCPDKNIVKGGSCAGLYKNPELAKQIILASKEAGLPVSCKIRIGDTKIDWESWIAKLLEAEPAAIAVHLRTRKEMSKVPAHWELMPQIVKFIHDNTTEDTRPLIIGNGDIATVSEAREKVESSGCDGAMIGRGIFGNPWLFAEKSPTEQERIKVLIEHITLYKELYTGVKHYDVMKRHFKAYLHGSEEAANLRAKLYETKSCDEALEILKTAHM